MGLEGFKRELELLKRDIKFREGRKTTLMLIKQILEDYRKIEEEFRVKRWRDRGEGESGAR